MNLAVIPARGGSKRIPRKNIKEFCGKPMLAWSIEAAQQSGCFDDVIVSTDDEEIAAVAQQYGATVPFMRPAELSDDMTGTSPVVWHAIETLAAQGKEYNQVCCIYATAPFLAAESLKQAMDLLQQESASFVFSVTSFPYPIQRALRINSQGHAEMREPEYGPTRSQDLEEAFHDAGQFYLGSATSWLAKKGVFNSGALPFILPRFRVQDIDTPEDWVRAELMMKALQQMPANQQSTK